MKASDLITRILVDQGVTHVYEMVGGMITHILDSMAIDGRITIVSMHHEQAAAFAAEGHSRMAGKPLVAMATSGPGATNLLTGIGSCFFDSIPAVFITGQVNRHEMKGSLGVRQLGFQETDIVAMARPVTKLSIQVLKPEDLQSTLELAFRLAQEGRPGPVLVDIPMDIQRADLEWIPNQVTEVTVPALDTSLTKDLLDSLELAQRPIILLGGGIRSGNAKAALDLFLEKIQIPICLSLMGVDAVHASHPLRVGLIGSYGNRWANHALGTSDCLLVLGSRLDIRQTGADTASFRGDKKIFHVDCDAAEMNNRIKDCFTFDIELQAFLHQVTNICGTRIIRTSEKWFSTIDGLKAQYPENLELAEYPGINPNHLMHEISSKSSAASAVVTDVGQHQMWAAQSWDVAIGQRFLTSGGMGSMGFSVPAAIGASFAANRSPVVVIAGDGGFQCNIQELETIRRNSLPIKMIILDNGCHGMVRQFQESYFDSRFQSTVEGYSAPAFEKVANAYAIPSLRIAANQDLSQAMDWLWKAEGPALLSIAIDGSTNVYPKLAFGRQFTEMEPQAKPLDMEGT